jgi:hypothetical protein
MEFVKNFLVPFLDAFKMKNPYVFAVISLILLSLNVVLVTDSEAMIQVIPDAVSKFITPIIGVILWLLNLSTFPLKK